MARNILPAIVSALREYNNLVEPEHVSFKNQIQTLALSKGLCFKISFGSVATGGHEYVDCSGNLPVALETPKKPKAHTSDLYVTLSAWRYDDSAKDAVQTIVRMQDAFTHDFLRVPFDDAIKSIAPGKSNFVALMDKAGEFGPTSLRTYWTPADKVFVIISFLTLLLINHI